MKKLILLLLLPFALLGQKNLVVHITTDSYPGETYWILMKDSLYGDTIAEVSSGHYTSPNTTYTDTVVLADSLTDITFLIRDTYGDGIMAPGNFYISICSDTVISVPTPNFQNGMYWNRSIPNCLANPPPGPCVPMLVNINLDQFQSETSWDIKDTMGNVLFAGGPYTNAPDYEPQFIPICAPLGNLTFTIYDSYGDGLNGSLWGGQDGSYYVLQCGDTLVYGNVPSFGTDSTHVFTSDTCTPPPPIPGCMDENYLEYDPSATVSDSSCATLKILGCTDSTMFNYDSTANYMDYVDSCDYTLILHDLVGNGWVGSRLEIYQGDTSVFFLSSGFTQQFTLQLKAPEIVRAKFFVSAQASGTALECGFTLVNPMGDTVLSVTPPFIQPFFTYVGSTYCGTECIEIIEGCMDSTAFNYDSLANTSDNCYYYPGCISPAYLEYHVDTTNGYYTDYNIQDSCQTLVVFGCMDSTMFNYDSSANVNSGCIPIIMGCMESLAFNYNPLANTPDTCIPYIYGCTDPTMFNYDETANTDDGNCIPHVYGCTDSTAYNYDPSANSDNGSCVEIIVGCMDQSAYNYDILANVHDSISCLFAATCATGPGNPYWLNDPCYAWVISVDDYCCENEWDEICQATYNYCEGTWTGPLPKRYDKKLIAVTDLLGRPITNIRKNELLFFIYDDGSTERKLIINK
tara:strand:- start:1474 stop:3534 length:2061 start_codon:yes stop_codon:yes gene_type:complete